MFQLTWWIPYNTSKTWDIVQCAKRATYPSHIKHPVPFPGSQCVSSSSLISSRCFRRTMPAFRSCAWVSSSSVLLCSWSHKPPWVQTCDSWDTVCQMDRIGWLIWLNMNPYIYIWLCKIWDIGFYEAMRQAAIWWCDLIHIQLGCFEDLRGMHFTLMAIVSSLWWSSWWNLRIA